MACFLPCVANNVRLVQGNNSAGASVADPGEGVPGDAAIGSDDPPILAVDARVAGLNDLVERWSFGHLTPADAVARDVAVHGD